MVPVDEGFADIGVINEKTNIVSQERQAEGSTGAV